MRILTGTLIEVGRNVRRPEDMPEVIAAKDRGAAGFTAPAQGLFLVEVFYNERSMTEILFGSMPKHSR